MSAVIISVLEVVAVAFTVWAIFHEDRFVAFEERLICRIKRSRLKSIRGGKGAGRHCA